MKKMKKVYIVTCSRVEQGYHDAYDVFEIKDVVFVGLSRQSAEDAIERLRDRCPKSFSIQIWEENVSRLFHDKEVLDEYVDEPTFEITEYPIETDMP